MLQIFEPVKLRATKSGKCLCGKILKRAYTFEQTINPFNRNKETGLVKTWQEIRNELKIEAENWEKEPCRHNWAESYWHWPDKIREAYDRGETVKVKMECGFYKEVSKTNF